MAKITISIELDSSESLQKALEQSGLLAAYQAPKPEAPKAEAPKAEAPKAETTPLDQEAPKSGSGVTLAALRVLLSTKVGAHRQAIKDKLSTLGGASTVSTLSVDHYDEFNEFMQSLK
jgi:hypothetical protein